MLHDATAAVTPSADPPHQALLARGCDVLVLLEEWELDPSEFEIRLHAVCDAAEFDRGTVLATVANRRLRASRTYLYTPRAPGWARELEQDLRAGVFGVARFVGAERDVRLEDPAGSHGRFWRVAPIEHDAGRSQRM